ncbi:MAG: TraU family protein [Parahaliea sp.]
MRMNTVMNSRFTLLLALSAVALAGEGSNNNNGSNERITTSELLEYAMDEVCMDYQVIGGCLWMTCTPYGCEYDYSLRVQHNIPEVLVQSYPFVGMPGWSDSPYQFAGKSFSQDGGMSDEGGSTRREQALKFNNADVVGSPGVLTYMTLANQDNDPGFCTPLTYPTPYFVSVHDPFWRNPTVEGALVLLNPGSKIGEGGSLMAYLFPRIGFVNQGHEYKASLVGAIRALDIVRRDDIQPHVYLPIDTFASDEQGQWPPEEDATVLWQQLTPTVEACKELPDIDDTKKITDPFSGRINPVYGNVWHVWRSYTCCEPAGATLIAVF